MSIGSKIVTTPGIDAGLISRTDLAVAYGVDSVIEGAVRDVVLAAGRSGIPCGVFVSKPVEARGFVDMQARFLIVGSDPSCSLRGWTSTVEIAHSHLLHYDYCLSYIDALKHAEDYRLQYNFHTPIEVDKETAWASPAHCSKAPLW
jgi:hypothetical protein